MIILNNFLQHMRPCHTCTEYDRWPRPKRRRPRGWGQKPTRIREEAGLESSIKVHKIHTTLFKTFFGRTFVERGTIFIQWYSEHIIIITILSYTTRIQILNNTHPMFFRTILREPSLWEAVQLCGMAPPPLQVFLEFPQGLEIR